jgi:hypothetical protein
LLAHYEQLTVCPHGYLAPRTQSHSGAHHRSSASGAAPGLISEIIGSTCEGARNAPACHTDCMDHTTRRVLGSDRPPIMPACASDGCFTTNHEPRPVSLARDGCCPVTGRMLQEVSAGPATSGPEHLPDEVQGTSAPFASQPSAKSCGHAHATRYAQTSDMSHPVIEALLAEVRRCGCNHRHWADCASLTHTLC